ncbi:MAG: hypothetical protein IKK11_00390 [Oscillospiraceae bacterium]|nr:hypothetical protein [Oscillospiraceae bacterium]
MNRKRCPWCGKIIDKKKDSTSWSDVVGSPSIPRMLRQANCSHCRNKYGQVPVLSYMLTIDVIVILLLILAFVFQSGFLFVIAFVPILFSVLMPYSKLDSKGKPTETNTDLLCEFIIIDYYGKFKPYELYFLEDCFDDFEPFFLTSPIQIHHISKKDNTVLGEFLYMHKRNYDYIKKDNCQLYDTEMNLIAKIKFIADADTIL